MKKNDLFLFFLPLFVIMQLPLFATDIAATCVSSCLARYNPYYDDCDASYPLLSDDRQECYSMVTTRIMDCTRDCEDKE